MCASLIDIGIGRRIYQSSAAEECRKDAASARRSSPSLLAKGDRGPQRGGESHSSARRFLARFVLVVAVSCGTRTSLIIRLSSSIVLLLKGCCKGIERYRSRERRLAAAVETFGMKFFPFSSSRVATRCPAAAHVPCPYSTEQPRRTSLSLGPSCGSAVRVFPTVRVSASVCDVIIWHPESRRGALWRSDRTPTLGFRHIFEGRRF